MLFCTTLTDLYAWTVTAIVKIMFLVFNWPQQTEYLANLSLLTRADLCCHRL